MAKEVYLTVLTQPAYLAGALVLHRSLQSVHSKYPLVVAVTKCTLPREVLDAVRRRGLRIVEIEPVVPGRWKNTQERRLQEAWTKLRAFELVQFDKIVLLDSDMLVRKNIDDLFARTHPLPADWIAATHVCACNPLRINTYPIDWIPENCAHTAVRTPLDEPPMYSSAGPRPYTQLNTGLVVLTPNKALAEDIIDYLESVTALGNLSEEELAQKYYFADQDLITEYFEGRWKPLPWYYNALRPLREVHPHMWSDKEVRIVHYILRIKPWNERVRKGSRFEVVNGWWWKQYEELERDLVRCEDDIALKWLRKVVEPPLPML
ncbi:glycosyltransferase family 8 protein [Flagelloscypha sp. PMI_526]|nr:glycosyltransferase family 8 protein [Flagelloscypha sp. PMI_526]